VEEGCRQVHCQRIFASRHGSQYFEVRTPAEGQEDGPQPVPIDGDAAWARMGREMAEAWTFRAFGSTASGRVQAVQECSMAGSDRRPLAEAAQDDAARGEMDWGKRSQLARFDPISQRIHTTRASRRRVPTNAVVYGWVGVQTGAQPLPVHITKQQSFEGALANRAWRVVGWHGTREDRAGAGGGRMPAGTLPAHFRQPPRVAVFRGARARRRPGRRPRAHNPFGSTTM
jgi:hypothetical protein